MLHGSPAALHAMTATSTLVHNRLLADHRELEDLFADLLGAFVANDGGRAAILWNEFDDHLTKHLEAEERFLIPRLSASNPREARTILQEHRHIRSHLMEAGVGVDLHIVRLEMVRGFVEELRAHARREDDILYRWADEHLGISEQSALLAALTMPHRDPVRTG
jgi:hemerythrin-like domain-containing protein